MTSSCQSKRRQSDYRYIWNQITLLVDESVPVLLLYNMASCSYSALFESVSRCGSSSNDAQDVQRVVISECNRDVFSHLKSLKIGPDEAICNEYTQKSITRSLHLVLGRVLCLSRVGYF